MPFSRNRNSRDDNSKRSRSNSENFKSKGSSSRSEKSSGYNDNKSPRKSYSKSSDFNDRPGKFERTEGNTSGFKKNFGENKSTDGKKSFGDKKAYGEGRSFDGKKSFGDRKPFNKEEGTDSKFAKRRPTSKTGRQATSEYDDSGMIRLNRYISNSGICSRRKADELIIAGVVTVNGEAVTELGTKVNPATDEIKYNGERLKREKMVYVLLNKPKDYITTTDDPQERRTVMHLVANATKERIYPVGRLDRNTTGLLLLTNDGNLAEKLSHPRNNISKIYNVELDKNLTQGDFNKIEFGIELEDGFIKPDDLSYVQGGSKREIGIQIHSGKNRIVRRLFESLGYDVIKLDRVVYANLTKKDLTRGRWRYLEEKELIQLKHLI